MGFFWATGRENEDGDKRESLEETTGCSNNQTCCNHRSQLDSKRSVQVQWWKGVVVANYYGVLWRRTGSIRTSF